MTIGPQWSHLIKGKRVGLVIIDPPLGVGKPSNRYNDEPWSMETTVKLLMFLKSRLVPPYTVVLYTLFSMAELQKALQAADDLDERHKFLISSFVMGKVSLLFFWRQLARSVVVELHILFSHKFWP